jgi:uncharacterized SAM-binding protein YcdF (DUF218 family)
VDKSPESIPVQCVATSIPVFSNKLWASSEETGVFIREAAHFNSCMAFFVRKLAEAILLPVGFCGLLTVVAVLLRRRWIALAAVAALCTLSTELAGVSLLRPLEHVYRSRPVADAPHADAIVVLAGSLIRGVSPAGLQWGSAANRFFTGVNLAKAQKARLLVISAGIEPDSGGLLRSAAELHGISRDRIVLTPTVLTTEDEARAISEIPHIHSILLVTSAFHMPRAALLFRSRGFDVITFPTDQRIPATYRIQPEALVPTAAGLDNTERALREYYGLLVYAAFPFLRGSPPHRVMHNSVHPVN